MDVGIPIVGIKKLLDDYIELLQASNINMPEVMTSYIQGKNLVYEEKYCGKNIIELGLTVENFDKFKPLVAKMLEVINQAMIADVYFDPHPKNFVFDSVFNAYYVDVFPPYSDYLKMKRLEVAADNEKQIITDNWNFFTKEFLAAHFCGDFLNIDRSFENCFGQIYEIVQNLKMFNGKSDEYIALAKKIRNTEDIRIEREIYLL